MGMGMGMGMGMCICMVGYVYVYVYVYVREYVHVYVYVYVWSANLFGQNLGKSGNHGSGIEETFFNKMRGQFSDTVPAIFRNAYGKRSGTVGGGRGLRMYVHLHFTWRVKMHSDIFLPVSLDDIHLC